MALANLSTECAAMGLRAGEALPPREFEQIRRRMMLEGCKWDAQVGDVEVLARFPLLMDRSTWRDLAEAAEALAREMVEVEREVVGSPKLLAQLGMPGKLRRMLSCGDLSGGGSRVMRFDFHPTLDGWRVSEVNSDVPGGYTESSEFGRLMGEVFGLGAVGNPAEALVESIMRARMGDGLVILLAAAGHMEDQQIVAYLAECLKERGADAMTATLNQLHWKSGWAHVESGGRLIRASAIFRFFQGEWLCGLSRGIQWKELIRGGKAPVINPAISILGESKRLPLLFNQVRCATPTWDRLLPRTVDPRDVHWRKDDRWVLKTAYCNNGDTVCIRQSMEPGRWQRACLDVWLHPGQWVAQERFDTVAIDTPLGLMRPCVGVYVIDGTAGGVYGRLSRGQVVDYQAVDVAVVLEEQA